MEITPLGIAFRTVDDAAPDRIVDGVPDAGDDGHDHDAQHAHLKHVGIILVEHALSQTEDQAGGEVAKGIGDLILAAYAARAGDVRVFHGEFLSDVVSAGD